MVSMWDIQQAMAGVTNQGSLGHGGTDHLMSHITKVWKLLNEWIDEYAGDIAAWKRDWVRCRLFVPLQIRLAMEQVLYERGGEYRSLITGFGPADLSGSSTGGGGKEIIVSQGGSSVSYKRNGKTARKRMKRRHRF